MAEAFLTGQSGKKLVGNAAVGDVLSGKTFSNANSNKLTGTMPNKGKVDYQMPINGSFTIPAGYHDGTGSIFQSITTKGSETFTPGTANQTVASGRYLTGTQTILGDANLVAGNIKNGVSIFGVIGSAAIPGGTAGAAQILAGYTFINSAGVEVTGTIPSKAAATYTPGTSNQTIAIGQYISGTQTILGDADLVTGNIKSGANIFGIAGKTSVVDTSDANATATRIRSGYTGYVNGAKITGSIPSKAAATYTPGTSNQTIAIGQYISGTQTITGDAELVTGNIRSGVSIFGVAGKASVVETSDANAIAAQIGSGRTAYINGIKITGTAEIAELINIWSTGAVAPASIQKVTSQLYNGKIYCPEHSGTALHIYDIASNSWSTGAAAPDSIMRRTSQLYNGKIYCPHGSGTALHIYDIASNSWSTGAVAPDSVMRYTSQLYNGKIYCPQSSGTALHIYDIASNSWSTGAVAPASAQRRTSQLYNGKIYCPENFGTALHIYDIATDSWSTGAVKPVSGYTYTSQLYNGRIYCPQHSGTALSIYNIATDSWSAGAVSPTSTQRYTSQLYKGKMYCPQYSGTALHIYDITSNSWSTGAVAPNNIYRSTSHLYNGKIYCPQDSGAALHIYTIDRTSDPSIGTTDAQAHEILENKTAYVDGKPVTGTMANIGEAIHSLAINGNYTIPKGYHDGTGAVSQNIPTKGAATYTPGNSSQSIAAGQYLSGTQTIIGDADLVTGNIKSGANIFGVAGKASVVDTADATAAAGDILVGKTAYKKWYRVNGYNTDIRYTDNYFI